MVQLDIHTENKWTKPATKINSKSITDLNPKAKISKAHLKENINANFEDLIESNNTDTGQKKKKTLTT